MKFTYAKLLTATTTGMPNFIAFWICLLRLLHPFSTNSRFWVKNINRGNKQISECSETCQKQTTEIYCLNVSGLKTTHLRQTEVYCIQNRMKASWKWFPHLAIVFQSRDRYSCLAEIHQAKNQITGWMSCNRNALYWLKFPKKFHGKVGEGERVIKFNDLFVQRTAWSIWTKLAV